MADFNILLEDSCLRGLLWVTASFADSGSCTSRFRELADLLGPVGSGKQGFPLQCTGLCLWGIFDLFFPFFYQEMVEF